MSKNFKLVLALALAAMMIVSMIPAFGDNGNDEGNAPHGNLSPDDPSTVTITGLDAGDTVTLYQVLEWDQEAAWSIGGWIPTSGFNNSILTSDAWEEMIDEGEQNYTGITSALAGTLSRASNKNNAVVTGGSVSNGTYSNTVSAPGLYMAIISPADPDTIYNPVFVSIDYDQDNGTNEFEIKLSESSYQGTTAVHAAKKSKLTLEKTAINASDYNGDDGDTADVDDVLTFTVKTTIPGYGETFMEPAFVLKDSMKNLEFETGSIVIKLENDATLGAANYTVDPQSASGYTIAFDPNYLRTLDVPTPITVTYRAKVLAADKIANVNQEINTVTLEYSHDPSTESESNKGGDKEYKKDITNHYTFSIDADNLFKNTVEVGESGSELVKVAVDTKGNPIYDSVKTYSKVTKTEFEPSPLQGAQFTLYRATYNETTQKYEKTGTVEAQATSDAHGRIKFENLDAGGYIMVETAAPTGFIRDFTEHTIVINAVVTDKNFTEYYNQDGEWFSAPGAGLTQYDYTAKELESYTITFDGANVATHTFEHVPTSTAMTWVESSSSEAPASIPNTQGVELPSTGGIGTTIFYVGGSLMVLAAAILLITKRRMGVEE